MSKKTYSCFVCQKNGFDNVQVFLGGRDSEGKTVYLEPDGMTKHVHQQQPQQQEVSRRSQQTDELVSRDTPQNEIQPPSLAQILHILNDLEIKVDRLTHLVYAKEEKKE